MELSSIYAIEKRSLVVENSPLDRTLFSHALAFLDEYIVDEPYGSYVNQHWQAKSFSLFGKYLEDKRSSILIPVMNDSGDLEYVQLTAAGEIHESAANLVADQLPNTDAFIINLIDSFPDVVNGALTGDVLGSLKMFVSIVAFDSLVRFLQSDRESEWLRGGMRLSLGLFLNILDSRDPIDNRYPLFKLTANILRAHGLYPIEDFKDNADLYYSTDGGKAEGGGRREVVNASNYPPNLFTIDILSNFVLKRNTLELLTAKEVDEPDEDYLKRLYKQFEREIQPKLAKLCDHLLTLTPENINKEAAWVAGIAKWGLTPAPVKLNYYTITGYEPGSSKKFHRSVVIKFHDNFSIIMETTPGLLRVLMDIAKLKPLTKSTTIYRDWRGGVVNLPKTLQRWTRFNDMGFVEKERLKFREADKAKIAIVFDRSESMTEGSPSRVCAACGLAKHLHEPGEPGHDVFVSAPPVRYAQYLATLITFLMRDFTRKMWMGYIDTDHSGFRVYDASQYETMLYDLWATRINSGTDYYMVKKLASEPDFLSGRGKKFLFIITDALEGNIFIRNTFDNFEALVTLAERKDMNLIFLQITSPLKLMLGKISKGSEGTLTNSYTRIALKFYIISKLEAQSDLCKKMIELGLARDVDTSTGRILVSDNMMGLCHAILKSVRSDPATYSQSEWTTAYYAFMFIHWDKMFITDYFKLALVAELQRFVNMVRDRNLLELTSRGKKS